MHTTLAVTVSGSRCNTWAEHPYMTTHLEQDGDWSYDGSIRTAYNFCRDPHNENKLWCYTDVKPKGYGDCNMSLCDSVSSTIQSGEN